jgi:hypothetical protein
VCIKSPPPDLDCPEVPYKNFEDTGSDPHGFDGRDNDGIGCEGDDGVGNGDGLRISPTPSPTQTLTPTSPPTTSGTRTIITNVNNVNINNVQDYEGAVKGTADCAPVAATIMLGPSTMEDDGARILAAFDPCVLTDGTVLLNLPNEQGIQLVAANIQYGQTTQSAIIPLERTASVTQGQVLFNADLNEQVTGEDPATGNSITLNGDINALFLLNDSGQSIGFEGDHSVALNAILVR